MDFAWALVTTSSVRWIFPDCRASKIRISVMIFVTLAGFLGSSAFFSQITVPVDASMRIADGAVISGPGSAPAAVFAIIRPLSAILLFPVPAYPFTGPIITRIPAMIPQKILFPALMLFLPPSLLSRRISPYKIWSGHSLLCHCLQNA